ncbi:hypothetical protein J6590_034669 [Homalodisca vitripennis]|nr:hypothetical protein J6590_034669 [Homalodisca vitripennis]
MKRNSPLDLHRSTEVRLRLPNREVTGSIPRECTQCPVWCGGRGGRGPGRGLALPAHRLHSASCPLSLKIKYSIVCEIRISAPDHGSGLV